MKAADEENLECERVAVGQKLLFPQSARAVCDEIGLNWWAALKLFDDGWLSFDPDSTRELDDADDAELRFVGSLVTAGCTPNLLRSLLGGLSKPYRFKSNRIYFDWAANRWRPLPEPSAPPQTVFNDWLESLVEDQDFVRLSELKEDIDQALSRIPKPTDR